MADRRVVETTLKERYGTGRDFDDLAERVTIRRSCSPTTKKTAPARIWEEAEAPHRLIHN